MRLEPQHMNAWSSSLKLMLVCALITLLKSPGAAMSPTLPTGSGTFVYDSYKPLANKPVKVHYYLPEDAAADAPIIILMHGNSRAATGYRNAMAEHALQHGFLLFVPEFSTEYYPSSRDYHQGGIFHKNGTLKKKKQWTFSLIEPLFDHIKTLTGRKNEGYILYGFSAGAQFVHRFNWLVPENRATKIIAAAAGSYTMPSKESSYPYGFKEIKTEQHHLASAFSKQVIVMVGAADTVLSRDDLPKSVAANKTGRDRVERAQHFFNACREVAARNNALFNWSFQTVPHVGHNHRQMAQPVARMLFGAGVSDTLLGIMKRHNVPGMQVLHTKDGKTQEYALGVAAYRSQTQITPGSLFQAASLSKAVMAYVMLRLHDRGVLSLDVPLSSYWHYPRLDEEPYGDLITGRMVLTHLTGLPNWSSPGGAKLKAAFKPGTGFSYSGEAFLYLQKVAEHLTGKSLQQLAEEEVFQPLGMKQSAFIFRENMAGYVNGHNDLSMLPARKYTAPNGAFSLITNARDYTLFVQKALLRGEGLAGKTHQMMVDTLSRRMHDIQSGMGVMIQFNEQGKAIFHTGSNPGFRAFFIAFPATGETLVCFTNSTNGAKLRREVAQLFLGPQTFPAFKL